MKQAALLFLLFMSVSAMGQISMKQACFPDSAVRLSLPALILLTNIAAKDISLQPIPENYYATHLGFFCRQELKMQQVHVPVTFRVGTMEQCNKLEQKPGYR